jgi:hypothetical protein
VANVAKRQCINIGLLGDNNKWSGLLTGLHARALGLLLCDERRSEEWPLSLVGSWAGDVLFLPHDEQAPTIARDESTEILPYGIETRTPAQPTRNLYGMATREFEEMTGAVLAMLNEFDPPLGGSVPGTLERLRRWSSVLRGAAGQADVVARIARRETAGPSPPAAAAFPAGERFLVVDPARGEYVNPVRLGEDPTAGHLLGGCDGARLRNRLHWCMPTDQSIYAAGEFSTPNPHGLVTGTAANPRRNLYQAALAEYRDITCEDLPLDEYCLDGTFASRLVRNASENDGLLPELWELVDRGGHKPLEEELIAQFGAGWRQRADAARRKRHPPVEPSWLRWNDGVVGAIAWTILDGERYRELPFLADALEQAGCDNADLLRHCRSPREHARTCARGCWVVEALLS